jgi:hypothetical protein
MSATTYTDLSVMGAFDIPGGTRVTLHIPNAPYGVGVFVVTGEFMGQEMSVGAAYIGEADSDKLRAIYGEPTPYVDDSRAIVISALVVGDTKLTQRKFREITLEIDPRVAPMLHFQQRCGAERRDPKPLPFPSLV